MSCWRYYSGVNKWTYHQHLAHFYKQKSILLFKATVMLATVLRLKMTVLPPYRISCRQGTKRGPADLQLGLVGSGLGSVGLGSVCKNGNKTVNKKGCPNRTDTVKPRIEAPGFYLYKCPWPPACNRDPACIRDPASIRTSGLDPRLFPPTRTPPLCHCLAHLADLPVR